MRKRNKCRKAKRSAVMPDSGLPPDDDAFCAPSATNIWKKSNRILRFLRSDAGWNQPTALMSNIATGSSPLSPEDKCAAQLKDLEIQWKDHFHMRDQTWKVLNNTILFFLGTVGLDIKGSTKGVMLCAYGSLLIVALFGTLIAWHHRLRQHQKFAMIRAYEEVLGLYDTKRAILEDANKNPRLVRTVFTVRFIELLQLLIGVTAAGLLINNAFT